MSNKQEYLIEINGDASKLEAAINQANGKLQLLQGHKYKVSMDIDMDKSAYDKFIKQVNNKKLKVQIQYDRTKSSINTQKGTGKKDSSNNVALSKSSKNHKLTNGNTQTPSHANNRFTVVKEADTSVISDNPAQKKIYKNSITTFGYRIRLYVGGSSREARQKAYSVGYLFKSVYMDIPVYTHFYSPHWMCSAGNFKTYEEASRFLAELKTTGQFGGAMIVKSKIQIEQ